MRLYSFHMESGEDALERAIAVKDGFSWPAFLFDLLWVLYHRLWLWAAVIVAAGAGLELAAQWRLLDPLTLGAAALGGKLLIGFHANDWRRAMLERRGYRLIGFAGGRDRAAAEQRFFDSRAGAAIAPPAATPS